jgi:starch synthase (maltosyl-transferring)
LEDTRSSEAGADSWAADASADRSSAPERSAAGTSECRPADAESNTTMTNSLDTDCTRLTMDLVGQLRKPGRIMTEGASIPLIYNLFQRLIGPMPEWSRHLDRIASMGFDWVLLNPFHQPGLSGSLYAVKDYYRFADMFIGPGAEAPDEQFRNFLEEAHRRGLRVMMDLVINHTAVDSPLTLKHPEWYKHDEEGRVRHPGASQGDKRIEWGDLAELDHEGSPDRENLWSYWLQLTEHYSSLGVDGYRCDAAYQVPVELWELLIGRNRSKFPKSTWLAETLGCDVEATLETAGAGFQYVYNSLKWWDYRENWALERYEKLQGKSSSIGFPESHDTRRLADELNGDQNAVKQRMYFTAFTATGWMIVLGFEWGFRKKCDVVSSTPEDFEEPLCDLTESIRATLALKREHAVLHQDCPMRRLPVRNRNVLVLHRRTLDRSQEALLLVNIDTEKAQQVRLSPGRPFTENGKAQDCSPERRGKIPPGTKWKIRLAPAEVKVYIASNHA